MVNGLLVDADVRGHAAAVFSICESRAWASLWAELAVPVFSFQELGLLPAASDSAVWEACQLQELVLLTGNRNQESPDSLEATIRTRGEAHHLPVLTFANQGRVLLDRAYAERVATSLIDRLMYIDELRGSGRLFLP
jgi:hypothetical protein